MQGIRCDRQLNIAAAQSSHCQKLRASQKVRITGPLLIDIGYRAALLIKYFYLSLTD